MLHSTAQPLRLSPSFLLHVALYQSLPTSQSSRAISGSICGFIGNSRGTGAVLQIEMNVSISHDPASHFACASVSQVAFSSANCLAIAMADHNPASRPAAVATGIHRRASARPRPVSSHAELPEHPQVARRSQCHRLLQTARRRHMYDCLYHSETVHRVHQHSSQHPGPNIAKLLDQYFLLVHRGTPDTRVGASDNMAKWRTRFEQHVWSVQRGGTM